MVGTGVRSLVCSSAVIRKGRETEAKEVPFAADNKRLVVGGSMKYALNKVLGMGLVALIGIAPQAHAQHALETIHPTRP